MALHHASIEELGMSFASRRGQRTPFIF